MAKHSKKLLGSLSPKLGTLEPHTGKHNKIQKEIKILQKTAVISSKREIENA